MPQKRSKGLPRTDLPMQPLYKDADNGVVKFRPNAIVVYIFDNAKHLIYRGSPDDPCNGKIDLNKISQLDVSDEDRQQFAQLIGYTLSGYHELGYVSDKNAKAATAAARAAGFTEASGCRDQGCPIHSKQKKG